MTEREIFIAALQKEDPAERRAYLDEVGAGRPELREQVEHLLRLYEGAGSFLQQPAADPAATGEFAGHAEGAPSPEAAGSVIGPYKLVQEVGEGGMGTVWLAQQTQPVKRAVALKVIKAGMDSRQVVARFEAERQALALMDHPNIARVLDGGTTAAGRPFFVMELVKGVPITRYCDERRLTPRQRLELFVPVCQAVQHAHQKGIIHRDLKPSNVLVALYDGKPVPKVIDFGVAKATGQQLTEHTLVTGFGAVVGTLEYMSPEQAELNQLDIDTRSDVYSLGVLLYELLTGTTPLEKKRLKEAAMLEVLRLIREEEPPRPSTRLSATAEMPSIAANRGLEPRKLSGLVRGELDWIVMKALEKDRGRRYDTANGFAQDIQRYLADEPVLACPPTLRYRVQKFVRRNKGPVLAATVILVLLSGGIVGTLLGLLQARREAVKARHERDQADAARAAAQDQRQRAEALGGDLRRNLYFAEMNLAGQAAHQRVGLARVAELLPHWQSGLPDLRGWEWYYLHGLCHQDVWRVRLSPYAAQLVAWSPDGTRLATSTGTGPRVWHAATGQEALILTQPALGHGPGWPSAAAWSPDGTTLASVWVGVLTLWDAATGKERRSVRVPAGRFFGWSADGTRLGVLTYDRIHILDARSGKVRRTLTGHAAHIESAAWSRQGDRLASADRAGVVKIWDGAAGKELRAVQADNRVQELSWSPDGTRLAGANSGGYLQVWEAATAKQILFCPCNGTPFSVAWSPDGTRLASGTYGQVGIWDAAGGKPIAILRGHSAEVLSVAWSPDGTRLASVGNDETLRMWDAHQKSEPLPLEGTRAIVLCVSWSPNGRWLASGHFDGMTRVWDTATGANVLTIAGQVVRSVAWSPDGLRLASAGGDGIRTWDPATGKEASTFKTGLAAAVAWSPDGTRLASDGPDNNLVVRDAVTGKCLYTFKDSTNLGQGNTVHWSPDGTRLASIDASWTAHIWDAVERQPNLTFKGRVHSVAWSPDGMRLAGGGLDRTIKVWDTTTGKKLITLTGHTDMVSSVAWSPDGTRLASAGNDGIRIWDPASGGQTIAFETELPVASIAWSPDGLRLVAGCASGIPLIYDATRGYRLAGATPPSGRGVARTAAPQEPLETAPGQPAGHAPPPGRAQK